ncbi:MAG: hypothetical protein KAX49_14370 [Halanaerobiales bacterium]|nr:hypothetical protein [Halanaerobiales bacterium]
MKHFCEKNNVALDFMTTHHYPTDDPLWRNGDISVEEFIKLYDKYERGIIKKMTKKARWEAGNLPLYYTEWNTSAMLNDNQHDECYAASMIAKILADNDGLVEGYSFWTFSDIFEERSQLLGSFHGGFGLQAYAGIAKPAYRLFELYHGLGDERMTVMENEGDSSTLEMIATKTEEGIRCILYNHQVPGEKIDEESCTLYIDNINNDVVAEIYKIDDDHTNPKKAWEEMGSPLYIKTDEINKLHRASELVKETLTTHKTSNGIKVNVTVPAYGVCAIDFFKKYKE